MRYYRSQHGIHVHWSLIGVPARCPHPPEAMAQGEVMVHPVLREPLLYDDGGLPTVFRATISLMPDGRALSESIRWTMEASRSSGDLRPSARSSSQTAR